MGKALYRELRPQTFDDMVGQEYITTTLKNQLKKGALNHAYLLCGTRGTGKTTTAKILAKAANCLNPKDGEPCNECEVCKRIDAGLSLDVIEMDAASHNGVDSIRDIIGRISVPPTEKYKVYIMDEVHMLSDGAVNAFLKTLEEPPERTIFILATTDPQKLPITILSRCQRFDFTRINSEDIAERLKKIVRGKNIIADDESLELIARMSDGAMRDALSTLDQAISMGDGKIEHSQIIDMLGLTTNQNLFLISEAVIEKNISKAMEILDTVMSSGRDPYLFIKDLIDHYRNILICKTSTSPEKIINASLENIASIKNQGEKIAVEEVMRNIRVLQEAEKDSKWAKQSRVYLELALIMMCRSEYDSSKETVLLRVNKLESKLDKLIQNGVASSSDIKSMAEEIKNTSSQISGIENKDTAVQNNTSSSLDKPANRNNPAVNKPLIPSMLTIEYVKDLWREILDLLKSRKQMVLYASLATGSIMDAKDGIVVIRFTEGYSFNKQRLEKKEYAPLVEEVFSAVLKEPVKVRYVVEETKKDPLEEKVKKVFGEDMVEIMDA